MGAISGRFRKVLQRYFLALTSSLLVLAALMGLGHHLGESTFSLPIAAVAISVWFGGVGPGLFAAFVSGMTIHYWVTPPLHSFFSGLGDVIRFLLFYVISFLIIFLISSLRKRTQLLNNLISNAPDVIFLKGVDGRYLYANPALSRLSGKSVQEIIGKSPEEFLSPELAIATRRDDEVVLRTGEAHVFEETVKFGNKVSIISIMKAPTRDEFGDIVGLLAIGRDVTEQKRVENVFWLMSELGAVLATSLTLGEEGVIKNFLEFLNRRFADCSAVYLQGQDRLQISLVQTAGSTEEMREKVRKLAVPPLIARIMRTGQPERLDLSENDHGVNSMIATPIIIKQKTIGVLLVGASASSLRRYDERDVSVLNEFTNRLAVTLENSRLYKEAGDAVRARDEFISIASHELLAPLTSLDLRLRLLRRAKDISVDTSESIQHCQEDTQRLALLVDELLDLSRIQIGKIELHRQEFDLAELARQVVARFEPELHEKHIGVAFNLSPVPGE